MSGSQKEILAKFHCHTIERKKKKGKNSNEANYQIY